MIELKRCRFCGEEPKFSGFGSVLGHYMQISCSGTAEDGTRHHVEVSVNAGTEADALKKAVTAWNRQG